MLLLTSRTFIEIQVSTHDIHGKMAMRHVGYVGVKARLPEEVKQYYLVGDVDYSVIRTVFPF